MKINPSCIRKFIVFLHWIQSDSNEFNFNFFLDALAKTIKNCMFQLNDLSDVTARFYCGYTLMKHCAVNVGLERFQLNFPTDSPVND
jgi:hypothetical protein